MKYVVLAAIFGGITRGVIAAEEALPGWAQFGIMGLVIAAMVVTKQLVPGWIYAEAKAELAAVKAENKELVKTIIDNQATTAPALAKSTEVVEKAMAELQKRGAA